MFVFISKGAIVIDVHSTKTGLIGLGLLLLLTLVLSIPNFVRGVRRGHQWQTMADVRAIATAVEAYAVDHKNYPRASSTVSLRKYIVPKYIRVLPTMDRWENEYRYRSNGESYTIMSVGRDHVEDAVPNVGPMTSFNQDIIFSDGTFTSFPEGS